MDGPLSATVIVIFRASRQHAHDVLARDGSMIVRAISATRSASALFASDDLGFCANRRSLRQSTT